MVHRIGAYNITGSDSYNWVDGHARGSESWAAGHPTLHADGGGSMCATAFAGNGACGVVVPFVPLQGVGVAHKTCDLVHALRQERGNPTPVKA